MALVLRLKHGQTVDVTHQETGETLRVEVRRVRQDSRSVELAFADAKHRFGIEGSHRRRPPRPAP